MIESRSLFQFLDSEGRPASVPIMRVAVIEAATAGHKADYPGVVSAIQIDTPGRLTILGSSEDYETLATRYEIQVMEGLVTLPLSQPVKDSNR